MGTITKICFFFSLLCSPLQMSPVISHATWPLLFCNQNSSVCVVWVSLDLNSRWFSMFVCPQSCSKIQSFITKFASKTWRTLIFSALRLVEHSFAIEISALTRYWILLLQFDSQSNTQIGMQRFKWNSRIEQRVTKY